MSLAVVTRLLTVPPGSSDRVRTIALIIGAFTLIYRWSLRRKEDWNGIEPPHKLVDSLYFSATVFSAPSTHPSACSHRALCQAPLVATNLRARLTLLLRVHSSLCWLWRHLT